MSKSRRGAESGEGGTRSAKEEDAVRLMEGMVSARSGSGGTTVGRRRRTGVTKNWRAAWASPVGEKAPETELVPLRTVR